MRRLARGCLLGLLLLLGGCMTGARLQVGDVTLGWHHLGAGLHAMGSHVAIVVH